MAKFNSKKSKKICIYEEKKFGRLQGLIWQQGSLAYHDGYVLEKFRTTNTKSNNSI